MKKQPEKGETCYVWNKENNTYKIYNKIKILTKLRIYSERITHHDDTPVELRDLFTTSYFGHSEILIPESIWSSKNLRIHPIFQILGNLAFDPDKNYITLLKSSIEQFLEIIRRLQLLIRTDISLIRRKCFGRVVVTRNITCVILSDP